MLYIWCIFATLCLVLAAPSNRDVTNTAMHNTITSNGYEVEFHQATSEDGYILGMFRMPYARYQTAADADRPVVFLMHGLYGESLNFILVDPEIGFAYNLVDAGFDVWFGNARGNIHSRAHTNLDPDSDNRDFFDFSWDEIGIYDVPAMIDYILDYTGKEKLHYIGHSQGGTVFLVMGSMRTEYNDKMASVHLLAPAGYKDHFPDPVLGNLAQFSDIIYNIALVSGLSELSLDTFAQIEAILADFGYTTDDNLNRTDLNLKDNNHRYLKDVVGAKHFYRNDDDEQVDTESELVVDGFGGGSIKQIAHYGQNIRDLRFRRYNYGLIRNLIVYGSASPPDYNLGLITSNVVMHYSMNDSLVDGQDVLAMTADMPNAVARRVARDSFDHSDYVVAVDAKELVTDFIIESIYNVHYGISESENETEGGNEAENENENETESENGTETEVQDSLEIETPVIDPEGVGDDAAFSSLNLVLKIYLMFLTMYLVA